MKFLIFIRANALVPSQTYGSVDFYVVVSVSISHRLGPLHNQYALLT